MESVKTYENFPLRIVALSNIVSLLIYISGVVIILHLGWIAAALYLVFIASMEYRLISRHCVNCYYWGRICGFGKGRLSSLLFKKGSSEKFCANDFSWKDLIPDLLLTLIPVIAGVILVFVRFDLIILLAIILLIALTTMGNSFIRGSFACKYCRQREIGCPAEKLFSKTAADKTN
jgi:hypothetical protein